MTSTANTGSLMNKRAVARRFGRAAGSYDAYSSLQLACARSLLEMLPAASTEPLTGTAVDLGCATAPLAREQQQRWPDLRWLGLDLSPAMLVQARERGRTGARFLPLCADAEQLPLAADSVALVFSSFALQWCLPERVCVALARVLASNGQLLLAVPLAGSLRELSQSWAAADPHTHLNTLPTEQDWRRAFKTAGLMPLQWRRLAFTEHYPDVKTLVRAFKASGVGHTQNRSPGLVGKKAWQAMEHAYERQRQTAGLPLTWEVLFVAATPELPIT